MASDKHQYQFFGVVIDAPKESPSMLDILRGYEKTLHDLSSDFVFLATIIHDRDKYDNGEPKRTHLHAFFECANTLTKGQALKRLEEALNVAKEQISIDGSNSDILLVQYLTHQNHLEKAQYSADEIKTNNRERLLNTLSKNYQKPVSESDLILSAVIDSKSALELARTIGIEKANKYRGYFNQIKEEQRLNLNGVIDENTALKEAFKNAMDIVILLVSNHERATLLDRDWEDAKGLVEWYKQVWKPFL